MKTSKLLPPVLIYGSLSLYLVGGFVQSMEPKRTSIWKNIFGPLAIDLGSNPRVTGFIMMGLDILLFVGLILYIKRLKRLEGEAEALGKVTQDQGGFGN